MSFSGETTKEFVWSFGWLNLSYNCTVLQKILVVDLKNSKDSGGFGITWWLIPRLVSGL